MLGATVDSIPCRIPYLTPAPRSIDLGPPPVADPRLKVGIAWAGSPTHQNDRHRSCRLADFAPLLTLPDVAFYSLQVGPQAAELKEPGSWSGRLVDLGDQLADYACTAAAIGQLDLVIAVDTSVVHLAGALGRPAWAMISARSDWRWMLDREDTPWYPTLRIFRQSRLDDWSELFNRVADALARWQPGRDPAADGCR